MIVSYTLACGCAFSRPNEGGVFDLRSACNEHAQLSSRPVTQVCENTLVLSREEKQALKLAVLQQMIALGAERTRHLAGTLDVVTKARSVSRVFDQEIAVLERITKKLHA